MITLTITTIFVEVIKDFTDGWAEDKDRKTNNSIQRVRELHYEYLDAGDCAGCDHIYPCPTIKALDGEQK